MIRESICDVFRCPRNYIMPFNALETCMQFDDFSCCAVLRSESLKPEPAQAITKLCACVKIHALPSSLLKPQETP